MAFKNLPPLTDDDGEARELTADDLLWGVRTEDFSDHDAAIAFMNDREDFFRAAAALGIEREAFASFDPAKPGFLERAVAALESLVKHKRHAAE